MGPNIKFDCFYCAKNITQPAEMVGETIDCPWCGKPTKVTPRFIRHPAPAPVSQLPSQDNEVNGSRKPFLVSNRVFGVMLFVVVLITGILFFKEMPSNENAHESKALAKTRRGVKSASIQSAAHATLGQSVLISQQDELVPQWKNITLECVGGIRKLDSVDLRDERLQSKQVYQPPVEIEYVCKTDSTNIRLEYGCDELIFNWELNRSELRIGGGPANGQHRPGKGEIPVNKFVAIRQVVLPEKMEVYVDDDLRALWQEDFSKVASVIGIRSALGSLVTVKSIRVKGAHTTPPAPSDARTEQKRTPFPDGDKEQPVTHESTFNNYFQRLKSESVVLSGPQEQTEVTLTRKRKYILKGSYSVPPGKTLIIEDGVVIQAESNSFLQVFGSLKVKGTEKAPVLFFGEKALPCSWRGICGEPQSLMIEYALIRDAVTGSALPSGTIKSCLLTGNYWAVDSKNCMIINCIVEKNTAGGIHSDFGTTTIQNCTARENGSNRSLNGDLSWRGVIIGSANGRFIMRNSVVADNYDIGVADYRHASLVENCVIEHNTPADFCVTESYLQVSNCWMGDAIQKTISKDGYGVNLPNVVDIHDGRQGTVVFSSNCTVRPKDCGASLNLILPSDGDND